MECKFQVGDAVLCVKELNPIDAMHAEGRAPKIDEIYHVREIGEWPFLPNVIFVRVREIILPSWNGMEMAFHHTTFRKLLTIDDFKTVETVVPVDSKDKVPEHV